MLTIQNARNEGEYLEIIQDLQSINHVQTMVEPCLHVTAKYTKKIANWAEHKKHIHVSSAICKCMSLMTPEIWEITRPHTNAVEQSAQKAYSYGKHLSLHEAIRV